MAQQAQAPRRIRFPVTTVVMGMATLAFFVLAWTWPGVGGPWGPGTSTALAWAFFGLHVVVCGRRANPFDPIIWIPVLMLLFFMGTPIAIELLGAADTSYDSWQLGRVPPHLNQAFAVALLSIVGFLFGVHTFGIRDLSKRVVRAPLADRALVFGPAMALLLGGTAMMFLGILMVGPKILLSDYGTLKLFERFGGADFRLLGTGHLFAQGGVFGVLACHDPRRSLSTWLALAVAALLSLLLLVQGDRGGLSALLFGAGFVYVLRVRPVRWWIVIAGFVSAFLAVPLIGEFRAMRQIPGADQPLSMLAARTFAEMGSTIQVICYTLYNIPQFKRFDLGASFVVQVLSNIPNFGLGPAREVFSFFDPIQHLPSAWLTSTVAPAKFATGGGYGFAYPAELYFNFGMAGVALGMVITGAVTSWVRNRAATSAYWVTCVGLYVSMMALLVRNSVGYPLRTALWPFIGLMVLHFVWPRRRPIRPLTTSPELAPADIERTADSPPR